MENLISYVLCYLVIVASRDCSVERLYNVQPPKKFQIYRPINDPAPAICVREGFPFRLSAPGLVGGSPFWVGVLPPHINLNTPQQTSVLNQLLASTR